MQMSLARRGNYFLQPFAPLLESCSFLFVIAMSIVNGSYTRFNMIEYFRNSQSWDTHSCNLRSYCSSKVMRNEVIDIKQFSIVTDSSVYGRFCDMRFFLGGRWEGEPLDNSFVSFNIFNARGDNGTL